jgi:secreted PhoX family phosphatase
MRRLGFFTTVAVVGIASSVGASGGGFDFGVWRDKQLRLAARFLFGVDKPLKESSHESVDAATAEADPRTLATVAKGLRVRVVTRAANAGENLDMIAFWPNSSHPTHLVACNETDDPTQPGVQRIRLSDGEVETILSGTIDCDPVRRTPWGTIIVGEENGTGGQVIEIIHPLQTTNVVFDHDTGVASGGTGAANVVSRRALGRLSFEGIALYPNGVMYYGDEQRPETGTPGGAYFKFIPSTPWAGGNITSLSQSPLAAGTIYGLRLGKRSGDTDYGQGSNTGLGTWVPIPPAPDPAEGQNLRGQAASLKLTGYYRPEDLEVDPGALAGGKVRFCGANTGNEDEDHDWGEAICITDGTLGEATANAAIPGVQFLVMGTPELAMPDNVAYQPGRGNWILHEDGAGPDVGRNNDLWDCLDDGDDDDSLSDGCVRVASLNDLTAEWTGGIFDGSGRNLYVSVQHNVTGHGVILRISGWN